MAKSLKNYTLKHLAYALPLVVAIWAALFYAFILDEVYDNVDDGLKKSKDQYHSPSLFGQYYFKYKRIWCKPISHHTYR